MGLMQVVIYKGVNVLGQNQSHHIITDISNFNPFRRRDISEVFMRFRVNKKIYTIEIKNMQVLTSDIKHELLGPGYDDFGFVSAYYEHANKKDLFVLKQAKTLETAVKDVLLEIGRIDGEVSRTFQHTKENNREEQRRVMTELKGSIAIIFFSGEMFAGPGYVDGMYVV
jgi:hypothetical protein